MLESEFLSSKELTDLTGYRQTSGRTNWLARQGIPHRCNGRGVVVSRVHMRQWLEGKSLNANTTGGVNFSAIT